MLEKYLNKRVKIFIVIGEQELVYTGQVTAETQDHFYFTDKYDQELLLAKDTLKQIKVVETND